MKTVDGEKFTCEDCPDSIMPYEIKNYSFDSYEEYIAHLESNVIKFLTDVSKNRKNKNRNSNIST